ncbi:hypothetical protein LEP1GSC047_2306 [Leptospira inadai serovar Lyme str. 10]|uniref:Uncharacterized protein n=1 Tax=Leptospira inadai serovar Lyme str. 10 TaxID=1049790 RepID=V6HPG7_9LEPT|nr:hypothetical protein [Leptospira inadai]EQA38760.1 hypothetical protein LEP1GSC047_2306 [Leptospira inadai serovar Lyme str. 10]
MKKNLNSKFWKKIVSLFFSESVPAANRKLESALELTAINIRTLRAFEDIFASDWKSFQVGDILRQYETITGYVIPKNQIVIVTKVYETPKTKIERHSGVVRTVHGWIICHAIDGMIELEVDFRFFRKSSGSIHAFKNGKDFPNYGIYDSSDRSNA